MRTRLFVIGEPTTFIGKDPWPAIPEGLLKIMWQLLCAGRKTNQVTAPVARSITPEENSQSRKKLVIPRDNSNTMIITMLIKCVTTKNVELKTN